MVKLLLAGSSELMSKRIEPCLHLSFICLVHYFCPWKNLKNTKPGIKTRFASRNKEELSFKNLQLLPYDLMILDQYRPKRKRFLGLNFQQGYIKNITAAEIEKIDHRLAWVKTAIAD